MLEKKIHFVTSVGRGTGLDARAGEPSHIHIPRPSRVARLNTANHAPEPSDQAQGAAVVPEAA